MLPKSFLCQNDSSELENIWKLALQLTQGLAALPQLATFVDNLCFLGILNDPKRRKVDHTLL